MGEREDVLSFWLVVKKFFKECGVISKEVQAQEAILTRFPFVWAPGGPLQDDGRLFKKKIIFFSDIFFTKQWAGHSRLPLNLHELGYK